MTPDPELITHAHICLLPVAVGALMGSRRSDAAMQLKQHRHSQHSSSDAPSADREMLQERRHGELVTRTASRGVDALYLSLLLGLILASASPALSFLPPPAAFGWGCPPCNASRCPPPVCDEALRYADSCGCCVLCAKLEGGRCGGRGDAGGRCNESELHCAYRPGSIFGEERMGVCEHRRCQRRSCGYRQRCKVVVPDDGSTRKLCKCDHFRCDHKLNLVCGRDGHTYSSVCHLQTAECLSGGPIGIRHFNQCAEVTTPTRRRPYNILQPSPPPIRCIHGDEFYSPFHVLPPTPTNPCTYHVCSDYRHMEQYPVLGCEGNPPEAGWQVEEVVVPAAWSEWSRYTECDGTCDTGGWENRSRTCTNPPPSSHREAETDALLCEGESWQTKLCEPAGCRICHMTDWSRWSSCSTIEPCQQGWRERHRSITNIPTVPELCGETLQNTTCQFLHCRNCALTTTQSFKVVNTSSRCFSRRANSARLCVGTCGPGKCCSGVYDHRDHSSRLRFFMDCPNESISPENVVFYMPVRCRCRGCNRVKPTPRFMRSPWKVVY